MSPTRLLFVCYGRGGHHAQARRLLASLYAAGLPPDTRVVSLTDTVGIGLNGTTEVSFPALREKDEGFARSLEKLARRAPLYLRPLGRVVAACTEGRPPLLISLGPSFALFPALLVKLFGGTVVHVETWSRFSSRSPTGWLLRIVADRFFVQNRELLARYPDAVYSGRL